MAKVRNKRVLSLFSGCGGLDWGFLKAGFSIEHAYDISSTAVETYKKNFGEKATVCDLSNYTPEVNDVEVMLAGSPCQGFSTAGKRNFSDPRNLLLTRTGEIAIKLKPKVLLAENVPGALSGEHKTYWEGLENTLKNNGYKVMRLVINAQDLGVAQRRKRLFMLAWLESKEITFHLPETSNKNLSDCISNIPESVKNHNKLILPANSTEYRIAQHIKPGQKLSNVRAGPSSVHTWDIPSVYGIVNHEEKKLLNRLIKLRRQHRVRTFGDADPVPIRIVFEEFGSITTALIESLTKKSFIRLKEDTIDLAHTFNGNFRRLQWEMPSYTVDTYFGNPRYFLHPDGNRGFTVREAARIQGFPDTFIFPENSNKSMELIGNAVSPIVAQHLATFIRDGILA